MPPKKKKGAAIIDGVDTSLMSREQLEKFTQNLRNEIEREREERNYFQLERDKLRTFWEITKDQLEEAKLQIRAKEREVEVAQEQAELDIKHIAQQMKHLKYENQMRIGEIRAESMTQLKLAQEDHGLQEQQLLNDKRELRQLLCEKDEMTEMQLQQLKMKHIEMLSTERVQFKNEIHDLNELNEQKLQQYIDDSEKRHRMELNEIDERKTNQIMKLIEEHEMSMNDMRNYYNDITQNNLNLISNLKEQMEELRNKLEHNERQLNKVTNTNRKLSKPLNESQIELTDLRKKLEHFTKERTALQRLRIQYASMTKELSGTKWEMEALKMRCEKLTDERDQLRKKFEEALLKVEQKKGLKCLQLERKINELKNQQERLRAIFGNDTDDLSSLIEKNLKEKDEHINAIENDLVELTKKYNELMRRFDDLMKRKQIACSVAPITFAKQKA